MQIRPRQPSPKFTIYDYESTDTQYETITPDGCPIGGLKFDTIYEQWRKYAKNVFSAFFNTLLHFPKEYVGETYVHQS